jgi:tetratricopeptide (TPR) repeat protein
MKREPRFFFLFSIFVIFFSQINLFAENQSFSETDHTRVIEYQNLITKYKTDISNNPKDAGSYYKLGQAYLMVGENSLAIENLSKAKKLFIENENYKDAYMVDVVLYNAILPLLEDRVRKLEKKFDDYSDILKRVEAISIENSTKIKEIYEILRRINNKEKGEVGWN